jgi:hypothetical protein
MMGNFILFADALTAIAAQIPGARSPGQLNFVPWHLKSMGSHCGACFLSPFGYLEF